MRQYGYIHDVRAWHLPHTSSPVTIVLVSHSKHSMELLNQFENRSTLHCICRVTYPHVDLNMLFWAVINSSTDTHAVI